MARVDYVLKTKDVEIVIESEHRDETPLAQYIRNTSDALVDQLVTLRKEKNMTQQDVADIVGVPRANISRLERKLYTPTLGLLIKYADSLGKTIRLELDDK